MILFYPVQLKPKHLRSQTGGASACFLMSTEWNDAYLYIFMFSQGMGGFSSWITGGGSILSGSGADSGSSGAARMIISSDIVSFMTISSGFSRRNTLGSCLGGATSGFGGSASSAGFGGSGAFSSPGFTFSLGGSGVSG